MSSPISDSKSALDRAKLRIQQLRYERQLSGFTADDSENQRRGVTLLQHGVGGSSYIDVGGKSRGGDNEFRRDGISRNGGLEMDPQTEGTVETTFQYSRSLSRLKTTRAGNLENQSNKATTVHKGQTDPIVSNNVDSELQSVTSTPISAVAKSPKYMPPVVTHNKIVSVSGDLMSTSPNTISGGIPISPSTDTEPLTSTSRARDKSEWNHLLSPVSSPTSKVKVKRVSIDESKNEYAIAITRETDSVDQLGGNLIEKLERKTSGDKLEVGEVDLSNGAVLEGSGRGMEKKEVSKSLNLQESGKKQKLEHDGIEDGHVASEELRKLLLSLPKFEDTVVEGPEDMSELFMKAEHDLYFHVRDLNGSFTVGSSFYNKENESNFNRNISRLKQRLKKEVPESANVFFDERDNIKLLPNPILDPPIRNPRLFDSFFPSFPPLSEFLAPAPHEPRVYSSRRLLESYNTEMGGLIGHPAQKLQNGMQQFDDQVQFNYVLEIRLKRLEFKNHPLMTLENRLSKEMSDLVEMTNDRQRNNVISILKKKLENVKGEYARQKEQFVTKFGLPDVQYGGYVAGTSIPLEHQPESVSSSSALLSGPFSTSPAPSSPLRSPAKLSTSADNTADNTPVPSLPSSPIRRNLKTIFEVTKASGIPSFQLEFINREENTLRQERLTKMRRLKEIRDEIKNLRRLLDAEHHTDKLLQYRIMLTWEKLKSVRTVQGYTSTNSKLMIRRVENDKQADIDALRAEIKAEMKELKESNEMDYRLSVEEYFHKQHDYENTSRDTTENTVKLNDEVSFKTEHETEDSKADMEDRNLSEDKEKRRASETLKNRIKELSKKTNIQSTEELVDLDVPVETPSKPALAEFHASSVRKAIVERFNTSRRMPGTPSFYFRITEGEGITSDFQCPMSEQKRRRQIAATFLYLKLQYNGKLVTKTIPKCIDVSDFTVKLSNHESGGLMKESNISDGGDNDVIQLIVQECPEKITVDLWEQGVFGDRKICSLYFPPPLALCHSSRSSDSSSRNDKDNGTLSLSSFEFASCLNESRITNYSPDESLYKQLDAELFESELRNRKLPPTLNGLLKANVKWAVDEEGKTLGPTYDGPLRGEHSWTVNNSGEGAVGPANIEKFKKWITAIDVRNPSEMTDELKKIKERLEALNSIKSNRKVFRLSEGDNELILQEPDRESPTMRQLLQVAVGRHSLIRNSITSLRDSLHDISFVPGEESENIGEVSKESSNICALDISKQRVLKQRIRAQQLRRKGVLTPSSDVSEFVREVNLTLDVAKLTLWSTLFKERRPLRPEKRTRAVVVEAEIPRECMILIHVKRGMNVPIRKPDSGIVDVNNQKSSRVTVRPYLEVQFQRHVARTQVNEGPFPEWNETLSVPFALPNEDFRPESLQDICEDVHFNLFDEYVVDLIEDDRMREKNISVRKEKNWLGGFTVPLSAIYEQRQVQGTFHVKTPLLLFGYDKNSAEESSFKYFNLNIDKKNVSVDLYITMEPLLPLPKRFDCRFSSDEDDSLLRYATHWTSQLRNVSNNFVTPTVLDINGRTILITRFIRPQIPPNGYTSLTQIVRFVSLIPALSDRVSLSTDSEVWSTSEETFDIGAGGAPEHAILLTNYLIYLGRNAFVVLGHGNPEGRTAYVLVLEENNRESVFINPLNGDIYELRDPHFPLTSIGFVFNSANIYANIQRATGPHQLDFNLNDPRLWKPFLGPQYRLNTPLLSIQTETLEYQAISPTQLLEISNLIETKLIESIESWRSRHLTRWNRLCNRIFSNLLQTFEKSYLSKSPDATFLHPTQRPISLLEDLENKQYAELIKLQSMYRFSGFPLNFKWTGSSDQIVDFVHATRIWDMDDSNVEFGLAVHCDGYVNGIVSIWVYLACLGSLKRRD